MTFLPKILITLGVVSYLAACNNNPGATNGSNAGSNTSTVEDQGPAFKKQGELWFISKQNNDTIRKIDIEVARTDEERAKGLMYRRSMEETQGMLFIFDVAEEQSFWMKNTYISLDLLYIGENKEIVSIQKYATPLSEDGLPSYKKALYVVEVVGGYCDKYHITYGDKIDFKLD
ncbi:hypothetical protein LX64_01057 [Chitinophaga skermanii]|uniref:DUF192 domain-containing protein n=1 Tax=Chitinophaga skermanii TaxID=331697 RepID=A0A327QUP6_9BACT|nr:DUF192 domain-containing protein [Chitinophaga skermanii]RAJ08406.1 hypothetical protein LX64_01057 [Chitinophaga skermanii]